MNCFLYTLLLRIFSPLIWLWMYLRARRSGGKWSIFAPARFGRYGRKDPQSETVNSVWIHAVSLGETRAAQPLVRALLALNLPILLTHTTPTGWVEGARLFAVEIRSGQLRQAWLPYDFPGSTRRFMRFFSPRCGILIEREVWPNLIREASASGVSVVLVSARFSEASLRQSRWLKRALCDAYKRLDMILAQTRSDADRLRQMGAHAPHVMGNLKFDVALSSQQLEEGKRWRAALGRSVIAIASTREGEDQMFVDAINRAAPARRRKDVLHLLIPRHPQRFDEAATVLQRGDLPFVKRSGGNQLPLPATPVLLGDTLGEMAFYYAAADVAIIGGGFAPLGGQNLIEACAAGTPVIVGPHMHNFAQATQDAVAAGAAIQVSTADEALAAAYALLRDTKRREGMRQAALQWTAAHAGATQRIVSALRPWLGAPPVNDFRTPTPADINPPPQ